MEVECILYHSPDDLALLRLSTSTHVLCLIYVPIQPVEFSCFLGGAHSANYTDGYRCCARIISTGLHMLPELHSHPQNN